jgi:hypothetical protein
MKVAEPYFAGAGLPVLPTGEAKTTGCARGTAAVCVGSAAGEDVETWACGVQSAVESGRGDGDRGVSAGVGRVERPWQADRTITMRKVKYLKADKDSLRIFLPAGHAKTIADTRAETGQAAHDAGQHPADLP